MNVITFEDIPSSQIKEISNTSKTQKDERWILNKNIDSSIKADEKHLSPNKQSESKDSLPKPTGNTPRFGTVKKITSLKPLKPRPAKFVTKLNDTSIGEKSPIISGGIFGGEKSFDGYYCGPDSSSFVIFSPSNQKSEIGSAGNSPRRKPTSLKHPLISKKSPLFKKFGISSEVKRHHNPSILNTSLNESNISQKKQSTRTFTSGPENKRNVDRNKDINDLNQILTKHSLEKNPMIMEYNQFLNISLSNCNVDKSNDNFLLYSAKKSQNSPRGSLPPRMGFDAHSSEPQLNSEPSVDWANVMLNIGKTRTTSIKENLPTTKPIIEAKSPQIYPFHLIPTSNNRQFSANSNLIKPNYAKGNILEENFYQAIPLKKEPISIDYRKKNVPFSKRAIFNLNHKSMICNTKDGSINESFNSLELSAIVQDANERDIMNLSKDDGLLQYIDHDQSDNDETGNKQKNIQNNLYLPKQLTYDVNIQTDNSDANKGIKKTNSASKLDILDESIQNKESNVQQVPFKLSITSKTSSEPDSKKKRAVTHNADLNGGRRPNLVQNINEELSIRFQASIVGRTYGDPDRKSSMGEIPKQYKERLLFHPEDNETIEDLQQRRVESAFPRPETYFEEFQKVNFNHKEKNFKEAPKPQVQIPSSEKNNLKHFQFAASPSLKQTTLDSQDCSKKLFQRLYLHTKPGTSNNAVKGYTRREKLQMPNRSINPRINHTYNSVGPSKVSLNETGLDDSSNNLNFAEKVESRRVIPKPDLNYRFGRNENIGKFSLTPGEISIQKLREEIKKLQVKDQESQMKIAKLHIQLENQNKEWEKKYEFLEHRWKHKLIQQKEYYEKSYGGNGTKKIYGEGIA